MKRLLARVLLPVLALALAGTACGGSAGADSGTPAGALKAGLSDFMFTPSSISTPSGKVVFNLVNTGSSSHDMVIADSTGKIIAKSDIIQPGGSGVFTVASIPAGDYKVTCDLPGHVATGITATLAVT